MQLTKYIDQQKYVLWGLGVKGKALLECIDLELIVAIIDINEQLQGTTYKDIDVISFEMYRQKFSKYYVITTSSHWTMMKPLEECNELKYFSLSSCPNYLYKNDDRKLFEVFPLPLPSHKETIIWIGGLTLFTIILINGLKEKNYENIRLINKELEDEYTQTIIMDYGLKDYLCGVEQFNKDDIIYCTSSNQEQFMQLQNNVVCKVVDAFDMSTYSDIYSNKELERFKNKHKGERCFIVATGASLTNEDLNILEFHSEVTISMNNIMVMFENTNWRPDYYCVVDTLGAEIYEDEIEHMEVPVKLVSDASSIYWNHNHHNSIYKYHSVHHLEAENINQYKFSNDFSKVAYVGGTVTYVCIQWAVYLGFTEIYLLGVDFTHSDVEKGSNKIHCGKNYNNTKGDKNRVLYVDPNQMQLIFKVAREVTEGMGVRIYNATKGGKLEVFERIDFDSLFGEN